MGEKLVTREVVAEKLVAEQLTVRAGVTVAERTTSVATEDASDPSWWPPVPYRAHGGGSWSLCYPSARSGGWTADGAASDDDGELRLSWGNWFLCLCLWHLRAFSILVSVHSLVVLVVQEKNGTFPGTEVWKFPTGAVDEGEDIFATAVREVKEETGIDSEFVEVLAFRQSHKFFFEKSDLFFVCMMRPLSFDIQKQESEIHAAEWMPFEEYAAQPFVQRNELMKYINNTCLAKIDSTYSGFSPVPITSSFSDEK
ncbi:hypothetical protein F2P56_006840, partial [Juglans regia]